MIPLTCFFTFLKPLTLTSPQHESHQWDYCIFRRIVFFCTMFSCWEVAPKYTLTPPPSCSPSDVSRIEKKRTVIPALVDAVQNHQSAAVNLTYFYRLLFTTDNLKLVHIVCHKKVPHLLQCDTKKMYKRATKDLKTKTPGKEKRLRIKWIVYYCLLRLWLCEF